MTNGATEAKLRREPSVVLIVAPDPQTQSLMREAVSLVYPSAILQLADDARQAQRLIVTSLPDWMILDLNLLDDLRDTIVPDPARKNTRMKVVAIAGHNQDDRILPALRSGVKGFVMKRDPQPLIADQLRKAGSGAPALTSALAGQILRELDWNGLGASLSEVELELLTWIYAGDTVTEAANRMQIDVDVLTEAVASIWSKTVFPCAQLRGQGAG